MANPYDNAASPTSRAMAIEFDFPFTPEELLAEKKRREAAIAARNEMDGEHAQAKEEGEIRRAFNARPKRPDNSNDFLY